MNGFAALIFSSLFPGPAAAADPTPRLIRETAVSLESPTELPDVVYAKLKGYSVITIGEVHGTNEAPAFALGLVRILARNARAALLALEIPTTEQAAVDSFL